MSDFDEGFVFDGLPGLSCEAFVRLVRQYAFSKERGKDAEWIAQFAATRMDGVALRWLEEQDEDTQDSWKLLRRALLSRWPAVGEVGAALAVHSNVTSHSNVPTPAAAPPPLPQRSVSVSSTFSTLSYAPAIASPISPREISPTFMTGLIKGRLRVVTNSGVSLGHVGRTYSKYGHHAATRDISDALHVEILPSKNFHAIKILNAPPSTGRAFLGAAWGTRASKTLQKINSDLIAGKLSRAGLATVIHPDGSNTLLNLSTSYEGPSVYIFWNLLANGSVITGYEAGENIFVRLSIVVGNVTGSLSLTNSFSRYAEADGSPADFTEGFLVFEPL